METTEAILKRRSVRSFKDKPVPDDAVKKLLDAARLAPTGGNRQPWKFVAVRNPKMIRNIKMFSEGLGGVPTLVIGVCCDDINPVTVMDIAMASENVMIQCVDLGLGSCAIASFNQEAVKKLLEVPAEVQMPLLLSIGYPEGEPRIRPKKELKQVAYEEKYGGELKI
jgi:nitroreductase